MVQHVFKISALAAVFALLSASHAGGTETSVAGARHHVPGEKLDSGLGELPHYRDWATHPQTRTLVRRADLSGGDRLDNGQGRNLSAVSSAQVDRLGATSY